LAKMDLGIKHFDCFETLLKQVARHVYLADPSGEYITASTLQGELKKLAIQLNTFYTEIRKHDKIWSAKTYLQNNFDKLTSYKSHIEEDIIKLFPEKYSFITKYILPVIEFYDRYERSYEDSVAKKYWTEKIFAIKKNALIIMAESEFDELLNATSKVVCKYAKSNSIIENINNQVRRFLDTYKTIPSWFCDIFNLYWNFHKLTRGKRAGFAPIELLTGEKMESDWLELILKRFPYHKLKAGLD